MGRVRISMQILFISECPKKMIPEHKDRFIAYMSKKIKKLNLYLNFFYLKRFFFRFF